MMLPGYRYEFSLSKAEVKEATAVSRIILNRIGHPRLIRLVMLALLVPVAILFGFVIAPAEIVPLSADGQLSIALFTLMAAFIGNLSQRMSSVFVFRLRSRPYRHLRAVDRTLVLGQAGVEETVGSRYFGLAWGDTAVRRTRSLLLFLSPGGEWLALPLRLLPDGPEPIEREIAAWRKAVPESRITHPQ